MKNPLTLLLALLFILPGCTVYHKTPVSIEETVDKGKVKLVKTTVHEGQATEETKKFSSIIYEDSSYFGLNPINDGDKRYIRKTGDLDKKTQIIVDDSMSFYLKNRKKSIVKSILIPTGVAIGLGTAYLWAVATAIGNSN